RAHRCNRGITAVGRHQVKGAQPVNRAGGGLQAQQLRRDLLIGDLTLLKLLQVGLHQVLRAAVYREQLLNDRLGVYARPQAGKIDAADSHSSLSCTSSSLFHSQTADSLFLLSGFGSVRFRECERRRWRSASRGGKFPLSQKSREGEREKGRSALSEGTLPQEGENLLRRGVGLRQHRRTRLLDDLVLGQIDHFLRHVRVANLALGGRQVLHADTQEPDRTLQCVLLEGSQIGAQLRHLRDRLVRDL